MDLMFSEEEQFKTTYITNLFDNMNLKLYQLWVLKSAEGKSLLGNSTLLELEEKYNNQKYRNENCDVNEFQQPTNFLKSSQSTLEGYNALKETMEERVNEEFVVLFHNIEFHTVYKVVIQTKFSLLQNI
jgi:hypothetical protein